METSRKSDLINQPEIVELLQILNKNGLQKEQIEVESLVKYLDGMNEQFSQIVKELQEIKGQLVKMQDGGERLSADGIVQQAGEMVQEVGKQFETVRKNFLQSVKNAIADFQSKGKEVLKRAVAGMKIHSAFGVLEKGLHRAVEKMNNSADKMETLNSELQLAGGHMKNIGRILLGKATPETETQALNKGTVDKIRKSFLTMSGRFSSMEQTTINVQKRLEQFTQREEKKPSVKKELKKLKEEKRTSAQLSVPVKENVRG